MPRYSPSKGVVTHSESIDGSNDGLADLGDLGPVTKKVFRVVLNKVPVLHLLDIGTSYFNAPRERKKAYLVASIASQKRHGV